MSYQIIRSNGSIQTITDGAIDTSKYSIGILGRNTLGYGEPFANSQVHILENFASGVVPSRPIRGQLWFDTSDGSAGKMKINNNAIDGSISPTAWHHILASDNLGNVLDTITSANINTLGATTTNTVVLNATNVYSTTLGSVGNPITTMYLDSLIYNGSDLDANTLQGSNGAYYTNYANFTNAVAAPFVSLTSNSTMGVGAFITLSADPVNNLHAATKSYVDSVAAGLDIKASCRAATTVNITLSGTQTIDGVVLIVGDRVLVKNQSVPAANGIYAVSAGAWLRTEDADNSPSGEVTSGMYTFITNGTLNVATGWILVTPDPISLDVTALTFTQAAASTSYVQGSGISISGNTIAVDATVVRTSGTQVIGGAKGFTSPVGLPLGSSGATALYFGTDSDTGFMQAAASAGTVDFISNGVFAFQMTTHGVNLSTSGTDAFAVFCGTGKIVSSFVDNGTATLTIKGDGQSAYVADKVLSTLFMGEVYTGAERVHGYIEGSCDSSDFDDYNSKLAFSVMEDVATVGLSSKKEIMTLTPAGITATTGDIMAVGNVIASFSDERLKDIVGPLENSLELIKTWKTFYYTANDKAPTPSKNVEIGLSAQSVQATHKELIVPAVFDRDSNGNSISGEDYLTIKYERCVAVLVDAINQQTKLIEDMAQRIKALENK